MNAFMCSSEALDVLNGATHVLSSIPPIEGQAHDPVRTPLLDTLLLLSSTWGQNGATMAATFSIPHSMHAGARQRRICFAAVGDEFWCSAMARIPQQHLGLW